MFLSDKGPATLETALDFTISMSIGSSTNVLVFRFVTEIKFNSV